MTRKKGKITHCEVKNTFGVHNDKVGFQKPALTLQVDKSELNLDELHNNASS